MNWRHVLVPGLVACSVFPAEGALIDDFSGELRQIVRSLERVDPVSLPSSIFDTRTIWGTRGIQQFEFNGPEGYFEYDLTEPPPETSGNTLGYFDLIYETDVPVNLLSDGATAFRLSFENADVGWTIPSKFYVDSPGTRGIYLSHALDGLQQTEGPVDVDLAFTDFVRNVDFTTVTRITLQTFRAKSPIRFRMTSISTVPEPTTMSMLLSSAIVMSVAIRMCWTGD